MISRTEGGKYSRVSWIRRHLAQVTRILIPIYATKDQLASLCHFFIKTVSYVATTTLAGILDQIA